MSCYQLLNKLWTSQTSSWNLSVTKLTYYSVESRSIGIPLLPKVTCVFKKSVVTSQELCRFFNSEKFYLTHWKTIDNLFTLMSRLHLLLNGKHWLVLIFKVRTVDTVLVSVYVLFLLESFLVVSVCHLHYTVGFLSNMSCITVYVTEVR